MNSQTNQVPHPPPPTDSSRSASKRSHVSSEIREYASRRRYWLAAGAVVLLLVMCLGIVFAAHHYYVTFGGQGFLKAREQHATSQVEVVDPPMVYLPLRQVATSDEDGSSGWSRRSPMEVPYYACGDQQASCEAYGQPNICCPVQMICHPTPYTKSNIYCCNSNKTSLDCDGSWTSSPKCMPTFFECLGLEGGGCCPTNTLCSPNGCITIRGPTTISSPTGSTTHTVPITVTEVPAATATLVKQGEIAQSGVGPKESVRLRLCLPYSCTAILVFIAALMGFL